MCTRFSTSLSGTFPRISKVWDIAHTHVSLFLFFIISQYLDSVSLSLSTERLLSFFFLLREFGNPLPILSFFGFLNYSLSGNSIAKDRPGMFVVMYVVSVLLFHMSNGS